MGRVIIHLGYRGLLLACFVGLLGVFASPARYDDYSNEKFTEKCEQPACSLPSCSCFGYMPAVSPRPQFVMLTFDDAITVANIETYRQILKGRNIKMTFFVCHEYNDYALSNELYRQGHEIAVHSVSHESNTDLWRDGSFDKWRKEMADMRTMLNTFGGIPETELVGHRAPFLQTAGNITFRALKSSDFLYDSSMPTRNYIDPPIWPYTLDYGYAQDCQILPCPNEYFEGLWEVPMVQYRRRSKDGDFFCSMLDACTPQPQTASDTKDFLMKNFLRHYESTRAPFPVFLHEAWLRDKHRLGGFLEFFDEILKMQDVFSVTIRQVIEYMKNPVNVSEIVPRLQPAISKCKNPEVCSFLEPLRFMKTCAATCPPYFPWVGTPFGRKPPKGFPTWN